MTLKHPARNQSLLVIDVGSSAIRSSILQVDGLGVGQILSSQRFALRLGDDVFRWGTLQASSIQTMLQIFKDIQQEAKQHQVEKLYAVATSAMREASNHQSFLLQLQETLGISLQLIDGPTEGLLSAEALKKRIGHQPYPYWSIDLGGGSLELKHSQQSQASSHPLGSVRLLRQFPQLEKPTTKHALDLLQTSFSQLVEQHLGPKIADLPGAYVVGTGGNLQILLQLQHHLFADQQTQILQQHFTLPALSAASLSKGLPLLAAMSPKERQQWLHLPEDKVDLLLPALLLILSLLKKLGEIPLLVCQTGLRQSLLYNLCKPSWYQTPQSLQCPDPRFRLSCLFFEQLAEHLGLWPQVLNVFHLMHSKDLLLNAAGLLDPWQEEIAKNLKKDLLFLQSLKQPLFTDNDLHLQKLSTQQQTAYKQLLYILQASHCIASNKPWQALLKGNEDLAYDIHFDLLHQPIRLFLPEILKPQAAALRFWMGLLCQQEVACSQ